MSQSFSIRVYDNKLDGDRELLFEGETDQSFRIGRQEPGEPPNAQFVELRDENSDLQNKLIIAAVDERRYSRRFAEVHLSDDRAEVRNTAANQPIYSGSTSSIHPQKNQVLLIPFELTIGQRTICVNHVGAELQSSGSIRSLPVSSPPSLMSMTSLENLKSINMIDSEIANPQHAEQFMEFMKTVLEILQNSPNSQEYFDNAAHTIAHLLDLDRAMIAFEKNCSLPPNAKENVRRIVGDRWLVQSLAGDEQQLANWTPSSMILDLIYQDKQTIYQIPDVRTNSLAGVASVIASPLRNADNEVIGVIYGDRNLSGPTVVEFREIDAMFIELFANGVSVGLQRLGQEQQISHIRARFNQFFTPRLANQLEANPTMLEPRSANVSVLFADIRGFSRIAERIGPEKTIYWINAVMNKLSDCVFKHEGVVVDYVGDEVMAMWGAPEDQPDHAQRAVLAALDMISYIPEINKEWEEVAGEPIDFGIGVNSGIAQVGNTGSDRKFKYGPLGDVVNVGSRLQGATKQLKARLLITESTAEDLPEELTRRRIRSVRFVNVERVVRVFEIPFEPNDEWKKLKAQFEEGLELYESGKFAQACQCLALLVNQWPEDGPSLALLADSVRWLQSEDQDFDPVWQLDRK